MIPYLGCYFVIDTQKRHKCITKPLIALFLVCMSQMRYLWHTATHYSPHTLRCEVKCDTKCMTAVQPIFTSSAHIELHNPFEGSLHAHYAFFLGGFVCRKLTQSSATSNYKCVFFMTSKSCEKSQHAIILRRALR